MKSVLFFTQTLALVLSVLFFGGCGERKKAEIKPAFPVVVGDVIEKDAPIFIQAIGNAYALNTVLMRPQVGGIILEAYVQEGSHVKKGDPLFLIDPRPYRAQLERAKAALIKDKAALRFAEDQVKRYKDIVKKEYISQLAYDQYVSQAEAARGQVLADQADIELAELNLEWCSPVSPIDGKVSQYAIEPGNLATANDPQAFIDIRQLSPIDIRFNIPQKEFLAVQEALRQGELDFEVILPQKKESPRQGKVYFIDNHIDLSTGTILIKGTVANEDEFLWPGEFLQTRLRLRTEPHALLVPEEAVRLGQEGNYLYVYHPDSSTAEYRKIVKGEKIDQWILIRQGVKKGERVILRGQDNLLPGASVYLASSEESEEKSDAKVKKEKR